LRRLTASRVDGEPIPASITTVAPASRAQVGPIGQGLFAVSAIKKGQTVAAFIDPKVVKQAEWPAIATARGIPDWGGIEGEHGFGPPAKAVLICRYYDDAFVGMAPDQRPKWTFMNHSKRAPTARIVLPRRGLAVHWQATRDIAAGEELTFNYGPQDSDELDEVDAAEHADADVWPPAAGGAIPPAGRRPKRARREP
jgi:hypothetical protein